MKGRISRQLVVELDFGIHKNDFHRDLPGASPPVREK